jgi:hypothetical protein
LKVGAGKTLTLSETLTATSGKLSTASTGTIITPTTSDTALNTLLTNATGNITATRAVTIDEAVTVLADTNLTLDKKVTIESGSLDLSNLFDPPTGAAALQPGGGTPKGKVILKDELVVKTGGTLKISTGNGTGVIPEIDWGQGGSVKIEKDGLIKLEAGNPGDGGDITYIGASGASPAVYTWSGDATTGNYVLLKDGIMEISGKLTAVGTVPGGSVGETITATLKTGSEFTLAEATGGDNYYEIRGTLVVENGSTLKILRTSSGSGDTDTELHLLDSKSRLVVSPGGTVDVAALGVISDTDAVPGEEGIRFYAYTGYNLANKTGTPTKVKDEGTPNATPWTLTATTSTTPSEVPALTIKLGTLQLVTTENLAVDGVSGSRTWIESANTTNAPAGKLIAGKASGTTVVFTGSEPVPVPTSE